MAVLIIFETVEGQTGKIARFAADEARRAGHEVVLHSTIDPKRSVSFSGMDKVILAAPVHERRHPKNFEAFIADNLEELQARDTMMLSVSLKAAFRDKVEEARDFLVEMEMRTKFKPTVEALVAGAVKTANSYDYISKLVMQHVVLRDQDIELKDGEREFTDWKALEAKLARFLSANSVSKQTAAGA